MEKTGLAQDPLTAGKLFMMRSHRPAEKVADFVSDLKKLFKWAFPNEELTFGVTHKPTDIVAKENLPVWKKQSRVPKP